MKDLKGKVAVVTGAASGMGLAFAQKFADEGMQVVVADIEAEALAMAEGGIRAKGASVLAHRLNVADPDAVEGLAEAAYRAFGAVHVVCLNAGVSGTFADDWVLTAQDWEWVLDVNLWGVVHGLRSFVPRMLAGGDEGHVVATSSMAGLTTGAVPAPYQVSKFGVVAVMEHSYKRLRQLNARVSCSVLCPGAVATNIMSAERNAPEDFATSGEDAAGEQMKEWFRRALAAGAAPDEIARQVHQAILDDQFYIIAAPPASFEAIRRRSSEIETRTNPTVA